MVSAGDGIGQHETLSRKTGGRTEKALLRGKRGIGRHRRASRREETRCSDNLSKMATSIISKNIEVSYQRHGVKWQLKHRNARRRRMKSNAAIYQKKAKRRRRGANGEMK